MLSRVSGEQFSSVLKSSDLNWLLLGFACSLLSLLFRALRVGIFFPYDSPRDWMRLYGAFGVFRGMSFVMPFRTGEVAALLYLKNAQLLASVAEALPVWIFTRLTDLFAMGLWLLIAVLLNVNQSSMQLMLITVLITLLVGGGCFFVMMKLASHLAQRIEQPWLRDRLARFDVGWQNIQRQPLRCLFATLIAFLLWSGLIATGYCFLIALQSSVSAIANWIMSVGIWGISLLPIHPPLGLGTSDIAYVGIFNWFEITGTKATSLALAIHLLFALTVVLECGLGLLVMLLVPSASSNSSTK